MAFLNSSDGAAVRVIYVPEPTSDLELGLLDLQTLCQITPLESFSRPVTAIERTARNAACLADGVVIIGVNDGSYKRAYWRASREDRTNG